MDYTGWSIQIYPFLVACIVHTTKMHLVTAPNQPTEDQFFFLLSKLVSNIAKSIQIFYKFF